MLKDGRLLAAYGRRTKDRGGFGEYASISSDGGRTWDCEIKLSGSTNDDLGYPASVELDDGTILTVYYQQPPTGGKPCIMATKWRLPDIGNAVSAAPRSFMKTANGTCKTRELWYNASTNKKGESL